MNHPFWRRKNVIGPGHAKGAVVPRPSEELQVVTTAKSRATEKASASAVTLVARKKQPLLQSGGRPFKKWSASVVEKILRLFPDFSSPWPFSRGWTHVLSVQQEPWN